jgi:hypothetical protein
MFNFATDFFICYPSNDNIISIKPKHTKDMLNPLTFFTSAHNHIPTDIRANAWSRNKKLNTL